MERQSAFARFVQRYGLVLALVGSAVLVGAAGVSVAALLNMALTRGTNAAVASNEGGGANTGAAMVSVTYYVTPAPAVPPQMRRLLASQPPLLGKPRRN